jgi:predicted RNA binding protein YcfA (HicA-like mRNA interferase family)
MCAGCRRQPAFSYTSGHHLSELLVVEAAYARPMKVGDVVHLLQEDGWRLACTRGSHRQYKHEHKRGRVTVPGKPSDDLAPGTLNSILKQAGLKR